MKLTDAELELVADLESTETHYEAAAVIQARGRAATRLYVVKEGWLYSSSDLNDGRRHILQIHHPGDIVGLQNIPFDTATSDLTAFEGCCLCPIQRSALGAIVERQPRLGALFMAVCAREQVLANDLKRATARFNATDRILFVLCVLISRLRITNTDTTDTMRFPVTQTNLGDMIGLTNVSVSKAMGQLEQDGWIVRGPGATIRILKIDNIIQRLDFENRFSTINTDWFPAPRPAH